MFKVAESNLLLLCDNNIFCASFPTKIVIGNVENGQFINNQYFEFDKCDIPCLTRSIVEMVQSIANTATKKAIFLSKGEHFKYYWEYEGTLKTVYILSENHSEITFKVPFSLEEFNDLISILTFLILPSLCLDNNACQLLHFVSDCPLEEIVPIKTLQEYYDYLKAKNFPLQHFNLCAYLLHYKEILISLIQLKSLYNHDLKNHVINSLI